MDRLLKYIAFSILLTLSGCLRAENLLVAFTQITNTVQSNPNGFKQLYIPAYFDGLYAFIGSGHGSTNLGVYANLNGFLQDIATDQTHIPNGSGQFQTFESSSDNLAARQLLSINDNALVFLGTGSFLQSGIYQYQNKNLSMIANQKTSMPGANGDFQYFAFPSVLADNGVGFWAAGAENQEGIFLADKTGKLHSLVSTSTNIPLGQGSFTHLAPVNFALTSNSDNPTFAFVGEGSNGQLGLYRYKDGKIHLVANENTQLPSGGTGFFTHFNEIDYDGTTNSIAFIAGGILNQDGVFYNNGEQTYEIANTQSFIPEGVGTFNQFSELSTYGRFIVFHGNGTNQQKGIYLYSGDTGSIYKVLDNTDKLNRKTIKNIYIGPESLYKNHLALLVTFTDGTQSIEIATFQISPN